MFMYPLHSAFIDYFGHILSVKSSFFIEYDVIICTNFITFMVKMYIKKYGSSFTIEKCSLTGVNNDLNAISDS